MYASGATPLLFAAKSGNMWLVRQLLALGVVDLNQATAKGATALLVATYGGHVDVVRALLQVSPKMYVW
jgi:ankyrin repeat protein